MIHFTFIYLATPAASLMPISTGLILSIGPHQKEQRGESWDLGRPELPYTLPRPLLWRGHSSFIQELDEERNTGSSSHFSLAFSSPIAIIVQTLVYTKIRLQPEKLHHSRKETLSHINTCYSRDSVKTGEFLDTLQHTLSQNDAHSKMHLNCGAP